MAEVDLGRMYGAARERLSALVSDVPEPDGIAVPACPGWSVSDVIAHLIAVAEDVQAGLLTAPPTDEWTAGQVRRRRGLPMARLLADWAEVAPGFQAMIVQATIWPAFLDVLAHEHDIRGALGRTDGRDATEVLEGASWLISRWRPPVGTLVRMAEREFRVGPADDVALELDIAPFEAFRFRLGRRSRDQITGLAWTGDPAPVLDDACVFGPAVADVIE